MGPGLLLLSDSSPVLQYDSGQNIRCRYSNVSLMQFYFWRSLLYLRKSHKKNHPYVHGESSVGTVFAYSAGDPSSTTK
jgi:hypothetical protein